MTVPLPTRRVRWALVALFGGAVGKDQDRALLMARRELDRQHWLGAIASATQLLATAISAKGSKYLSRE